MNAHDLPECFDEMSAAQEQYLNDLWDAVLGAYDAYDLDEVPNADCYLLEKGSPTDHAWHAEWLLSVAPK